MKTKGFFSSLADFSFNHLIAVKLIRIYYGLGMIAIGLGALAILLMVMASGWSEGVLAFLGTLIVAPLVSLLFFFFYLILHRIFCEILVVLFRIAESLASIDGKTPPASPNL